MARILLILASILVGAGAGIALLLSRQRAARRRGVALARDRAAEILARAASEADVKLQAAALEARLKLEAAEARLEEETQAKAREIEEQRNDLERREKDLKRRIAYADERMGEVERREALLPAMEAEAAKSRSEAEALAGQQRARLEQIAGYTLREAKDELRREMEMEARREAAATLVRAQEETRERSAEQARWIVTQAIQRITASQYAETTVTIVTLPGDEMKGRIIGREGRNIRAIEMGCGIDLIIDDTPNAIILSSFDPARRIVAKTVIDRLVEDGRIHPARIEEVIAKVKEEFDRITSEQGEAAAFELGLHDLNPRLLRLAGRLRLVSWHGQNLLDHTREVAQVGVRMAALLSARSEVVARAAFLHKVGFGDETNHDRSPLILSAELIARLGEAEPIIHCVQALYGMVAPRTVEAVLLQAAEKAVECRPGGRKEMLQDFLEHMTQLEQIALSFKGVREAHAVRAGKEVRVIVSAEEISDKEAVWLSKDIAARIEKESRYPGQLRVSVIRETRSVGFAM